MFFHFCQILSQILSAQRQLQELQPASRSGRDGSLQHAQQDAARGDSSQRTFDATGSWFPWKRHRSPGDRHLTAIKLWHLFLWSPILYFLMESLRQQWFISSTLFILCTFFILSMYNWVSYKDMEFICFIMIFFNFFLLNGVLTLRLGPLEEPTPLEVPTASALTR